MRRSTGPEAARYGPGRDPDMSATRRLQGVGQQIHGFVGYEPQQAWRCTADVDGQHQTGDRTHVADKARHTASQCGGRCHRRRFPHDPLVAVRAWPGCRCRSQFVDGIVHRRARSRPHSGGFVAEVVPACPDERCVSVDLLPLDVASNYTISPAADRTAPA